MTQTTSPTIRDKATATAVTGTYLQSFIRATDEWGLGLHHFAMMLHLKVHGDTNQADWIKIASPHPTTVSRWLAELGPGRFPMKKLGPQFVVTEPDIGNRRMNITRLTPRGRAILDQAAEEAARYLPRT
jgi:DNA-binding MarR family transcriptional regulator